MKHEFFTQEWVAALGETIADHATVPGIAMTWVWPIVLILEKCPAARVEADRRIYLDLWQGKCRTARMATASDLEAVPFVISGSLQVWRDVIEGKLDPLTAIILQPRQLHVLKGSIMKLNDYAGAAVHLVKAAAGVETIFPEPVTG